MPINALVIAAALLNVEPAQQQAQSHGQTVHAQRSEQSARPVVQQASNKFVRSRGSLNQPRK